MKIKLKASLVGPSFSHGVGAVVEFEQAEAIRLIMSGAADPVDHGEYETAVGRANAETTLRQREQDLEVLRAVASEKRQMALAADEQALQHEAEQTAAEMAVEEARALLACQPQSIAQTIEPAMQPTMQPTMQPITQPDLAAPQPAAAAKPEKLKQKPDGAGAL